MNPLVVAAVLLVQVGGAGMILQRDGFRRVVSLAVASSGAVLLWTGIGWRPGATAPIDVAAQAAVVDPLPQAVTLTAIVIGLATTAVGLALLLAARDE